MDYGRGTTPPQPGRRINLRTPRSRPTRRRARTNHQFMANGRLRILRRSLELLDRRHPNAPPIPPDPSAYWHPAFWRRGAPVGAIVLIALGVLFLLGQLDIFNGRLLEFSWPVFLIGLGVWLVVRRLGESQGGPK